MLFIKRERNGAGLWGNILLTISLTTLGSVFFFLFDLTVVASASFVFLILGVVLSVSLSIVAIRDFRCALVPCLLP